MTKVIKHAAQSGTDAELNTLIENALDPAEISSLMKQLSEVGRVRVLNMFNVSPMMYQMVARQIDCIFLNLIADIPYRPADLMGDENWFEFDRDGQRQMEWTLKHFAAHPKSKLRDNLNGTFSLKTK